VALLLSRLETASGTFGADSVALSLSTSGNVRSSLRSTAPKAGVTPWNFCFKVWLS
jgi:hypothetical protein